MAYARMPYNHRLIAEEDRAFYSSYKLIYRYAIVYNIIAFFICFVSIIIPLLLYALLFMAFAMPKVFAAKLHKIRMTGKRVK
jgi:hypothetical protein